MICPRCDEQGLIYKTKILNLGIELNICDECDACWPQNQPISLKGFKDLTIFLEEQNLTYDTVEIQDLGYIGSLEKKNRTYFNVDSNEIISLVDEAWSKKGAPLVSDLGTYIVDMKRTVGTEGESGIKIIVKPGTAEIKTAYPIKIKHENDQFIFETKN
jgi:hypothetical protein